MKITLKRIAKELEDGPTMFWNDTNSRQGVKVLKQAHKFMRGADDSVKTHEDDCDCYWCEGIREFHKVEEGK
jgi:hypothetical protein